MLAIGTDERASSPIPDRELERRWSITRSAMKDRGIDVLIMRDTNDFFCGYVKWFTDVPENHGNGRSVVFHADDLMDVVEQGAGGLVRNLKGTDPRHRGVGRILTTPAFSSAEYTTGYEATIICDIIERHGYKTVGFVGPGSLPYQLVTSVQEKLGGKVTFADATEFIDTFKAKKSADEIALIRAAAALQDQVFEIVLPLIKPGVRDIDIMARAEYESQLLGSEQGVYIGGATPLGERATYHRRHFQERRMRAGDHINLLIENSGPGGFYTELGRTIVLGKAPQELREAIDGMIEAQANTVRLLEPGRTCPDVFAQHNDYMTARGLPPETRIHSHSQGYPLVERPLIRPEEPISVDRNMCFAVHPGYSNDSFFASICDNFLVDGAGNERIHKTPQKLYEIA